MKSIVVILTALHCAASCLSSPIDQQQLQFEVAGDLALKTICCGQTFTAGESGLLQGIALLAEGDSWPDGVNFGSDLRVYLRSTFNGTPTDTVLASGFLAKAGNIESNRLNWIEIHFDTPYFQTEGEPLAFVLEELSGGSVYGWNNYAMSLGNPYASGQYFSTFTPGHPLRSSATDLAFKTIMVPEPQRIRMFVLGGICTLLARRFRVAR